MSKKTNLTKSTLKQKVMPSRPSKYSYHEGGDAHSRYPFINMKIREKKHDDKKA